MVIKAAILLVSLTAVFAIQDSTRSLNGTLATIEKNSYVASLLSGGLVPMCAAAIISTKHLLTNRDLCYVAEMARVGSPRSNDSGVLIPIRKFVEDHNIKVAIVVLSEDIVLGPKASVIKMTVSGTPDPTDGTVVHISGWMAGTTGIRELYELDIPTINKTVCEKALDFETTELRFCTGVAPEMDFASENCTFTFDFYGGACVYNGTLYGISAGTWDCGKDKGIVELERVASYRDWIDKVLQTET